MKKNVAARRKNNLYNEEKRYFFKSSHKLYGGFFRKIKVFIKFFLIFFHQFSKLSSECIVNYTPIIYCINGF